ncbi:MAG: hypothetical protein KY437_00365 [Actinobacteria bacterium]|nr:hypothetical protein [Actinomycetota bacterium]
MISTIHRYIGLSIVVALLYLALYGLIARIARREEVGRPFWGVLYYTETVLVVQIVVGVVLLLMGRRVGGSGFHLHYLYGSVFPFVVLLGGRLYSMRREHHDYVPIALGGFIAFGLTSRALMTGLGIG